MGNMGGIVSRLNALFQTPTPIEISMVGLDSAGKTTVLYQMKTKTTIATIPTIGFNVESFKVKNVTFNVWDIGGQDKIRALWSTYIENAAGIVFVVDIVDKDRWSEAAAELEKIISLSGNKPILVLANKADDPYKPGLEEEKEELINVLGFRKSSLTWEVRTVSAITPSTDPTAFNRLVSSFEWLVDTIKSNSGSRNRFRG